VLVSTAWDGTSRLWDPWRGHELVRFAGDTRHVSRDGRRLASKAGKSLAVREVNAGGEYLPLPSRPGAGDIGLYERNVSPDGRWLVASGAPRVWDLALRKEVGSLPGFQVQATFHT